MLRQVRSLVPFLAGLGLLAGCRFADPEATTTWLFDPATPIAEAVRQNFWYTASLVAPFLILAEALLIYVIFRFRARPERKPASFHENVKLEIFWTLVPAVTLVMIAVPSFQLLRQITHVPADTELEVQVFGHQFFWRYEYPEYGITLSDEPLVLPANKKVALSFSSVDVIHSWWVPAFGFKQDANPGRVATRWVQVKPGYYKGQCAELCGALHGVMWIEVVALPEEAFRQWVLARKRGEAPSIEELRAMLPNPAIAHQEG
nr:MAG: putative cytochrome c oxidase subunit 2 [Bacteroidota bacterium]